MNGPAETLEDTMFIEGFRYVIYGGSGYSARIFMEVAFQGSNLSAARRAFNMAMDRSRITVEWYFKEVFTGRLWISSESFLSGRQT